LDRASVSRAILPAPAFMAYAISMLSSLQSDGENGMTQVFLHFPI